MWFHESSREYEDVRYLGEGLSNSVRAFYDEHMELITYYLDLSDPVSRPAGVGTTRFEFGREDMAALMREAGAEGDAASDDPSIDELAATLASYAEKCGFSQLSHAAWCSCKDWEY